MAVSTALFLNEKRKSSYISLLGYQTLIWLEQIYSAVMASCSHCQIQRYLFPRTDKANYFLTNGLQLFHIRGWNMMRAQFIIFPELHYSAGPGADLEGERGEAGKGKQVCSDTVAVPPSVLQYMHSRVSEVTGMAPAIALHTPWAADWCSKLTAYADVHAAKGVGATSPLATSLDLPIHKVNMVWRSELTSSCWENVVLFLGL